MTVVLAARDRFDEAQKNAREAIDRERALYGRSIKHTRVQLRQTQDAIAKTLCLSREQVRRYERYYEDWVERNGTEPDAS
ncbi:MAG: hypothetical protein JWO67_1048 [Streptosporangiaceae bacterium]|nr:hypothetical protein [Streptosporangiaceae bacterium]